MDNSVIPQLGAIVTAEGSRQERAALAADLVRRATGARWAGIYAVTDAVVTCDRVTGTLDVESDSTGAFGGASILDCERLADAMGPLWDQPLRQ